MYRKIINKDKVEKPKHAQPSPQGIDGRKWTVKSSLSPFIRKGTDTGVFYSDLSIDEGEMSRVHSLYHVKNSPTREEFTKRYGLKGNTPEPVIEAIEDCRISYLVDNESFPEYGKYARKLAQNNSMEGTPTIKEQDRMLLKYLSAGRYLTDKDGEKIEAYCKKSNVDYETFNKLLKFMRRNADNPRATAMVANYFMDTAESQIMKDIPSFFYDGKPISRDVLRGLRGFTEDETGKDYLNRLMDKYKFQSDMVASLGTALDGVKCTIKTLPMSLNHSRRLGLKPRPVDTGVVPRYLSRYPWGPMFAAILKFQGGSVLIDRSGSMSMSMEELLSILHAAPLSTVAEYNGAGLRGSVRIIATKGRSTTEKEIQKHNEGGGNIVDYFALKWLCKQDKPRIWISDGGVTGRYDNTFRSINDACAALCVRGSIVRLRSVEEALDHFGKMR